MNNTFDWNRFCKVVHKDLRNLWPSFGTTMLILVALPFALWLLMWVLGGSDIAMPADVRLMIIEYLAMFAALMAPSRLYRTWNLRGEGIYFAMLPASKLEKFVSALIYCLVVCPLAVYLGGLALDMVLTALPVGSWQSWIWQGTGGFPFTVLGYQGLLSLMEDCYDVDDWTSAHPELPIHFIAGADDPCIVSIEKFSEAVSFIRTRGYRTVTSKVYPGLRHEILNEIGKEDVWRDVSALLKSWL